MERKVGDKGVLLVLLRNNVLQHMPLYAYVYCLFFFMKDPRLQPLLAAYKAVKNCVYGWNQ